MFCWQPCKWVIPSCTVFLSLLVCQDVVSKFSYVCCHSVNYTEGMNWLTHDDSVFLMQWSLEPNNSESMSRCSDLVLANFAYLCVLCCSCLPSLSKYFYMSYRLVFGTLYPTYESYKALKHRDTQECVSCPPSSKLFSHFSPVSLCSRSVSWCTGWCLPYSRP